MSDQEQKHENVVIACGGTGGHLFPGISVGEVLQKRGHRVLLLISEKEIDTVVSEGHRSLEYRTMPSVGMGKVLSAQTLKFMVASWKAYRNCRKIISEFEAGVVLGMGGFTSFPPVLAGRKMGCRTFVHESNGYPGKANRLTGRYCNAILIGFEEAAKHFPGRTTRCVGTPVRPSFQEPVNREEALDKFRLEDGRKTILVMGGSQGARGINRAMGRSLGEFDPEKVQILHITGALDYDEVKAIYEGAAVKSAVVKFLHEMQMAYTVADLAVARSGASTLAELAFFGVPSILVPYPYAADDHQTVNAEVFSSREAALLAPEKELEGASLGRLARELLDDESKLGAYSTNALGLAVRDAADKIAGIIEEG